MTRPLRILGLADLHDQAGMLETVKDLQADLIVFCGDLHNASSREAAKPAAAALASLGLPVLIVPGNMDHRDVVPELWREAGFTMLHGSACRHGTCGFLGLGGMVVRSPQRMGDPARYYHREEDVYQTLVDAYPGISNARYKIIITHQPPRGARDTIYSGESTGSTGLRRFVEEREVHLLLCGHIHEDRGEAFIGPTRIINVGEMRRGYAALIEVGDEILVQWIGE
jgi:Icc-related predicted phosphoesterase